MQRSLVYILQNLVILMGLSVPVSAQMLDTLYYNDLWQMVSADSARYYRIAEIDTDNLWFTGQFKDYITDGSILMEGQYSRAGLKNGNFKSYHENGQVYCEGYFDGDLLAGTWNFYFTNGQLKEKVSFSGYDFIVLESYDIEGKRMVKNGTGKWVKQFRGPDGSKLEVTGRYYYKRREGNWRLKNQEGKTILYEVYSNDQFIDGVVLIPELGYYQESKFTSEIYYPGSLRSIESFTVWQAARSDYPYLSWLPLETTDSISEERSIIKPDKPAHYPLGEEAFYRNVAQNLVYPEEAKARKISGKVFIEFTIATTGDIYDIKVLRGIGGGCDQQAVLAIIKAGKWFPAIKNGFPVEQAVVIPVSFRLE